MNEHEREHQKAQNLAKANNLAEEKARNLAKATNLASQCKELRREVGRLEEELYDAREEAGDEEGRLRDLIDRYEAVAAELRKVPCGTDCGLEGHKCSRCRALEGVKGER